MILILFLLFAGMVFFLFVPIVFSFSFRFPDQKEFSLQIWNGIMGMNSANGAIQWNFAFWRISRPFSKPLPSKAPAPDKKASPSAAGTPRLSAILESRKVWKAWGTALLAFCKKLLRAVEIRECRGHLLVGLDSPAKTGVFMGYYFACYEFLSPLLPPQFSLTLEGDFTRNQISGTAEGKGKTSAARLLAPFCVLLLRAPWWRTYRIFAGK